MTIAVPNGFLRFSGWMLLLGGLIFTVVQYVHLEDTPANLDQMAYFVDVAMWTHIALTVAITLILLGLPGLFLRQSAKLKWWGWIGLVFVFAVFMLDNLHSPIQIFQYPVFYGNIVTEADLTAANELVTKHQSYEGPGTYLMMLIFPFLILGTILTAIAVLRAKQLSKWPAIAQLVLLVFLILPYGPVTKLFFPLPFLVYAWYGAILAFEKHRERAGGETETKTAA